MTSREKYGKYMMKQIFKDGYPFLKDMEGTYQDEQTSTPWINNVKPQQDANLEVLRRQHAAEIWK